MNTYQKITAAREVLELPEQATVAEIKANYRKLIRQWHPDHNPSQDPQVGQEMAARIIAAYRTIITFCDQYRFSFARSEIQNYLSDQEWWTERFGNDPLWGKGEEE